jgi:hypothetical protein
MAALPVGIPPPLPCGVDLRARRLDKVPPGSGAQHRQPTTYGVHTIGLLPTEAHRRGRCRRPRPPGLGGRRRPGPSGPVPAPSLGRGRSGPLPRAGRPGRSAGQRRREPARARRTSTRRRTTAAVETPCGPLPIRDGGSGRRRGTIPRRRSRRTIVVGPEDMAGPRRLGCAWAGSPCTRLRFRAVGMPAGPSHGCRRTSPQLPAEAPGRMNGGP